MVKAIPEGYTSITPYMIIQDADKAIEFYKNAFGAREEMRLDLPDGKVGHAELVIGDSKLMISEFCEQTKTQSGNSVGIHLYVTDVDAVVQKAVSLGAKLTMPVEDKFYGDRLGSIHDPFGQVWHISTHVEDVSYDEIKRRSQEMFETRKSKAA